MCALASEQAEEVGSWLRQKTMHARHYFCGSRTMSAQGTKRAACDELEALRSLLQKATEKVAKVERLLTESCEHTERVKVYPSGPRDNGECYYVCARCGDRE